MTRNRRHVIYSSSESRLSLLVETVARDLDAPRVSADDWRALLWLVAFAFLFIAICAVPPEAYGR